MNINAKAIFEKLNASKEALELFEVLDIFDYGNGSVHISMMYESIDRRELADVLSWLFIDTELKFVPVSSTLKIYFNEEDKISIGFDVASEAVDFMNLINRLIQKKQIERVVFKSLPLFDDDEPEEPFKL